LPEQNDTSMPLHMFMARCVRKDKFIFYNFEKM